MSEWEYIPPEKCLITYENTILEPAYNVKIEPEKRINKSSLIRTITPKDVQYSIKLFSEIKTIPVEFSWKKLFPELIEKPREQGKCGSCWSISVCSALGDRYSIKYNIKSVYPSAVWLITQTYNLMDTKSNESCETGGDPYIASKNWLEKNGTKLDICWPYSILSNNIAPLPLKNNCCFDCCKNSFSNILVYAKEDSTKSLVVFDNNNNIDEEMTIECIQREILNNGPVVGCFMLYEDFNYYWNNNAKNKEIYIYNPKNNILLGGHAVVITGWGKDIIKINNDYKEITYWEIRNSWGLSGDEGYGKIAFSTDIPDNKILQLDIPENRGKNVWSGGIISMEAGELNDNLKILLRTDIDFKIKNNNNTILIIIIFACFLLFFIPILIYIFKKLKKNNLNK